MKRRDFLRCGSTGLAGLALGSLGLPWLARQAQATGTPWKFGVMADTQWQANLDGENPGTCAAGIIHAVNNEFIAHGCRFVVQLGDLVDDEGEFGGGIFDLHWKSNLRTRAEAAAPLYDAGIGFYPIRGNHESSYSSAKALVELFPQNRGKGSHFYGVDAVHESCHKNLNGLSFAIDSGNVRIILIDQFTRLNRLHLTHHDNMLDQVDWVDGLLRNRPSDMHALVMSHKNLVGQNHDDCLFGATPEDNPYARNHFISSMQANKAACYMGGHDHMHHRSVVKSAKGPSSVEQVICASCSHKFYRPDNNCSAEIPIAQELFTIGYYIVTVDGPCLTVDFYSSSHGQNYGLVKLSSTPELRFLHRDRFGYSLNGKSFTIRHGQSYNAVEDTFEGTTARILNGQNGNSETDLGQRQLAKTVKTGWTPMPADAASAVLRLWGLRDNLSLHADAPRPLPKDDATATSGPYTLSLSYDPARVAPAALRSGAFGLKARTADGRWVDAVDQNSAGGKQFFHGPYRGQGLGAYGADPRTGTVWAVLNHDGTFAAK